MKKRSLGLISLLVLIMVGMFVFAGCSNSTDTATTDTTDKVAEATSDLKSDLEDDVDDFKMELDNIKDSVEDATGADAAALKERADDLAKKVEDTEAHIDKMVDEGTLDSEDGDSLKEEFDKIKTDAEDASKTLEEKADGATATAEDTAEGDTKSVKTEDDVKDYLDRMDERVKSVADHLDEEVAHDSKADIDYLKAKVDRYEEDLEKLGTRLDTLVKDNVITEDIKTGYDDTIDTLKADLDSAKEKLDEMTK